MSFRSLACCTLLWSAPFLGQAQSTPPAADPALAHRFYVGVGAYSSKHEYWGRRDGLPATYPVQFTLGYQLRPRLALQLSGVSAATKGSTSGLVAQANGMGLPYRRTYANRSSSLAALARYTLAGKPAQRFHVDGLGGFTLHRATFDGTGSYPDSNAPGGYGGYDLHTRDNDILLMGGVSVRYRLCTHFEAVADGTLSASLRAMRDVTPAVAVGLRYNFGRP